MTHTRTTTRVGEGGGGKRGSNLRRHCKISIGVKGELREQDGEGGVLHIHTASSNPLPHHTQRSPTEREEDRHLRRCMCAKEREKVTPSP